MKTNKLVGIFCIFLLLSFPFSIAQADVNEEGTKGDAPKKDPNQQRAAIPVGGGEINFELDYPDIPEDLDIDENLELSGRDVFSSDIIINVNRYEPNVLTTNLIEEQNVPIFAFLSAAPAINLGDVPRITSMDVSVIGGGTKFVSGKPKYTPPPVYTYDDIGYITTWLKRIPKEEDVPARIDLKLKARIRFEGDVTAPMFGGKEKKLFREARTRDIFAEGRFIDPEFSIFGGRGYIRPAYIGPSLVRFDVYGSDGVRVGTLSANVGQESNSVSLVQGSNFPEDQVRIRVERIIDQSNDFVRFEVEGQEEIHNPGGSLGYHNDYYDQFGETLQEYQERLQTQGYYTGDPLGGIKESSWYVSNIFVPQGSDQSHHFVALKDVQSIEPQLNKLVLIYDSGESFSEEKVKEWYKKIYEKRGNEDETLRQKLRKQELESGLDEIGVYSKSAKNFLNGILPVLEPDEINKKVESTIEELKGSIDHDDREDNNFPKILEVSRGGDVSAEFRVYDRLQVPYQEGYIFDEAPFEPCIDNNNNKHYCKLERVSSDYVTISYPYRRDGGICERRQKTLNLNADYENYRTQNFIDAEQGYQNIPPSSFAQTRGDSFSDCGATIELININTNRQVEVTVLSGFRRGYTESIFNLHIPIEKRAINVSIDELEEKIESTQKLIDELDEYIEDLEKLVSAWSKVCLGVSAWFTIEAFLVGLPKYTKGTASGSTSVYEQEFTNGMVNGNKYYTKRYNNKSNMSQYQIYGVQDLKFYNQGKKPSNLQFVYDKEGNEYIWDPKQAKLVPAPKLKASADRHAVKIYKTDTGQYDIIFGVNEREKAIAFMRELGSKDLADKLREGMLNDMSSNGYYFRYTQGEALRLYQIRGNELDFQELRNTGELDDYKIAEYAKDMGSANQRLVYERMTNQFGRIRQAQVRGQKSVFFGGQSFNINDLGAIPKTKYRCEDVLGSKEKCSILFNACDPVVCPRSRCTLGGQYHTGVSGVIGSGLVGSLILCLPNFKEENGGVIVPICLSGILASLKGIKSHLESYKQCLETQITGGVVAGTCDKLRSIFICQFIWKEALTLLGAKRGLLNLFGAGATGGGSEYFENGIGGSLEEADEVVSFIINDYADDVFSAYRGRSLAEIGAEVCKASIAQRIPFLDAFVQEFATPQNPPQFTAYFEESPYAPTLGKSQYQVYFHIYAGTPRQDQVLNYIIYLKSFGSSPRLIVGRGILGEGESADETVDLIGDVGYQEICVMLNGLEQCGFGRVVSSSFLISGLDDYLAGLDLSRNIQTAAQCKTEPTAPVTYTLTTGALPFSRIRRVCSINNPGLGLGEERYWKRVGTCGINEQGIGLGDCWEFGDLNRYPELERQAMELSCIGGQICEPYETCDGKVLRTDRTGRACCVDGTCQRNEAFDFATSQLGEAGLSGGNLNTLRNEIENNQLNIESTDEQYFAKAIMLCQQGRVSQCEDQFKQIKNSNTKLYALSRLILGWIFLEGPDSIKDLTKAGGYLRAANDKKSFLDDSDKTKLERLMTTLEQKEKEKQKGESEEKESFKSKLFTFYNKASLLRKQYYVFESTRKEFDKILSKLDLARTNTPSNKDFFDTILGNITEIDIAQDDEYRLAIAEILSLIDKVNKKEEGNYVFTFEIIKTDFENSKAKLIQWNSNRENVPSIIDVNLLNRIDEILEGTDTPTARELVLKKLNQLKNTMRVEPPGDATLYLTKSLFEFMDELQDLINEEYK